MNPYFPEMSPDLETSVGRKCLWARCRDGSPLIRGGFLEEASRVWEGRVLADLKRSHMKVLCARPWPGMFMNVFPVLKTTWEIGIYHHL